MRRRQEILRYNTIDLDKDQHYPVLQSCTKEYLLFVVNKILHFSRKNNCLEKIEIKDSNRKGYHIKLYCKRDCDLCRFVFDDFERYRRDINRKPIFQNVLFTSYYFIYHP